MHRPHLNRYEYKGVMIPLNLLHAIIFDISAQEVEGRLDGRPVIFEMQLLLNSELAEIGKSYNKAMRINDEFFRLVGVKFPLEILDFQLKKDFQRKALHDFGCSDLQPNFTTFSFNLDEFDFVKKIEEFLKFSTAQHFVLKHRNNSRGNGNIFLSREDLEMHLARGTLGDLKISQASRAFSIGTIKGIFVLEDCINPSFDAAARSGKVYRIGAIYNPKDPENSSHMMLLSSYYLGDSISSHDYAGSRRDDFIDKRTVFYDRLKDVVSTNRHLEMMEIGDELRHHIFRALKAHVSFSQLEIARTRRDISTYFITESVSKKTYEESKRNYAIVRSRLRYMSQLMKLMVEIGFKNSPIEVREGLMVSVDNEFFDLHSKRVAESDDLIVEKSKNFLHLLLPYIIKEGHLSKLDLAKFYHVKKLLLLILGINTRSYGKDVFNDYLVLSTKSKEIMAPLEYILQGPIPTEPFSFLGTIIDGNFAGEAICQNNAIIKEGEADGLSKSFILSKKEPSHLVIKKYPYEDYIIAKHLSFYGRRPEDEEYLYPVTNKRIVLSYRGLLASFFIREKYRDIFMLEQDMNAALKESKIEPEIEARRVAYDEEYDEFFTDSNPKEIASIVFTMQALGKKIHAREIFPKSFFLESESLSNSIKLRLAIKEANLSMVKRFIQFDAEIGEMEFALDALAGCKVEKYLPLICEDFDSGARVCKLRSAMFLAIKSDNKKITDFFLDLYEEKRIDLFKDERSSDILSIAIANRFIDVEIIAKFIAQGANINGIDDQGLNPLLSAVVYNKKDILSLLLKKYDEEEVNPFRNEMNIGIINFAIEHNPNPEILEILINAGAYLRFRDADGKKPLENIIDRALEFPLNSQYQNGAVFLVISHAILDVDFNSESMRKFYAEILLPENRFATEKFLKNLNQISKVLREEGGLSFTEILSLGINQDDILLAINVVTKDRYPTMNEDDLKIMIEREFENPDFNLLARNIFRLKKEGKTPDTKACVFYADAAYKGPETTVGK